MTLTSGALFRKWAKKRSYILVENRSDSTSGLCNNNQIVEVCYFSALSLTQTLPKNDKAEEIILGREAVIGYRDAQELTAVAIKAFTDDKSKYGSVPPGIDTTSQHLIYMKKADYFKIMKDDTIIGGIIVFHDKSDNYTLGSIFIAPPSQNQGIGKQAIEYIERIFPKCKKMVAGYTLSQLP
jgi:GNAT superfamily N-acetyltransferase